MTRLVSALLVLLLTACGLADSERDDKNKYIYITFSDTAFGTYCLENFDINDDGRISRYEAQRILKMDCSGRGIERMLEIEEFSRMQQLNCSGNDLTQLDLTNCTLLRKVDCSGNRISSLDVDKVAGLTELNCSDNQIANLKLGSNGSLAQLDCRYNNLTTIDLRSCSRELRADVRNNPSLTMVYRLDSQSVTADIPTY